jgi:hypothetical protein
MKFTRKDNSVCIVSDYRLNDRGLIPGRGKGFSFLTSVSRPAPPSVLANGYSEPFPGCKARPGRDADNLPLSKAKAMNE